jgi:retinol dehydrogenase 12
MRAVVPWGRIVQIKQALVNGSKPEAEGGTGVAQKFWDWCEEQVRPYT